MRSTMRTGATRIALIGTLLGLALVAAALAAMAQTRDGSMVRVELERTDELLHRAVEIVQRSGDPRAVADLRLASQVQASAWEHFNMQRFPFAHQRTMQARELGGRALRVAQYQGNAEQHARRLLDDVLMKLERAHDCAGDPPSEPGLRTLQIARDRFEQAREAFHETKYIIAIDIASQARRMLDDLCARRPGHQLNDVLENVRHLLERARQDLEACGPRANTLLERAASQLARAEEQARSGNRDAAVRLADQAKSLVLQAMRGCQEMPSPTDVDRILEEAATALDQLAGQVREAGNADAIALLDNAFEHLRRGRDLRTRDKWREALAEVRVARNLARRAARLAGVRDL